MRRCDDEKWDAYLCERGPRWVLGAGCRVRCQESNQCRYIKCGHDEWKNFH